jgi:hypothetical protein
MNCDALIKNNKYNAKDLLRRTHNLLPPLKVVHLKPSKRRLFSQTTSVLYTNGTDEMHEECCADGGCPKYQMMVPWLGVDRSRLEISDNIMIDIDAASTRLPIFCQLLHVNEGGTTSKKTCKRLMRDASIQFGATQLIPKQTGANSPLVVYSKSSSLLRLDKSVSGSSK